MFRAILAALLLTGMSPAQAAGTPPRLNTPVPGAPGTPTPTPYPQITPSTPPKAFDNQPGGPLLPPMPVPGPPREQPLPGLQLDPPKSPERLDRGA